LCQISQPWFFHPLNGDTFCVLANHICFQFFENTFLEMLERGHKVSFYCTCTHFDATLLFSYAKCMIQNENAFVVVRLCSL